MKIKLLAASLVLATLAAPALAADDLGAPVAANDWSGAYIGADAGYAWIRGADSFGNTSSLNGFLGGVHVGYNFMSEQFVFGGEIDAALLSASTVTPLNVRFETNWLASARARAGVAVDHILFYATAGVSLGNLQLTSQTTGTSSSNTHTGWVAGAGIEAFLTENMTARLEYQHHNFGNKTYNLGAANFQVNGNVNLVKFGVSYHF